MSQVSGASHTGRLREVVFLLVLTEKIFGYAKISGI